MIRWSDRLVGATSGAIVDVYLTDALGERVREPFGGFNLGAHVEDEPAEVRANRDALAEHVGVGPGDTVWMKQVHGAQVWDVPAAPVGEPPEADACIADRSGQALAVLVADCTPVLLADPDAGLVAAVHAGRPGMAAGVVPATVARMRERGATDLRAVIGPSVCGRCYEVPAELRDQVAARSPVSRTVSWTGTPAVDVAAGVAAQLAEAGVPATWLPGCTREDDSLYSYRRDGRTGRFAGVVVLRESA